MALARPRRQQEQDPGTLVARERVALVRIEAEEHPRCRRNGVARRPNAGAPSSTVIQAFSFTWWSPSLCPGVRTITTARASLPEWTTIGSRVPDGASISIRFQLCTEAKDRLIRP